LDPCGFTSKRAQHVGRLDIGVLFNKKDPKGLNGALAYTYTMLMLTRIFMELF
jgi:hypothetical protein